MNATDPIRDAVLDVLHAGPADRGWPEPPQGECSWCGRGDGDVLLLVHATGADAAHGHTECGEPERYRPAPPCEHCQAAPGEPCRDPGCPSLAVDPDPDDGPHLVTYTQPHPDHGTWTSPPRRFDDRAAAEDYVAAVTMLAGPGAASVRTWSIRPDEGGPR